MTPGAIPLITKSVIRPKDWFRLQMWQVRMGVYAGADAPNLFQRPPSRWWRWSLPTTARPRAASLRCAGTLSLRRALRRVRSISGRALTETLGLIGLVGIVAGIILFGLLLADTLGRIEQPEPETRCFQTMTTETDYCRSQDQW